VNSLLLSPDPDAAADVMLPKQLWAENPKTMSQNFLMYFVTVTES
jgi:hypothetical protein